MPEHQQMQQSKKPDSTFQKQATLTSQNSVSYPASIIQRVRIDPKSLTAADVLQLQRTIGNRAVGRLLSEIRNPLKVQQAPIQRQEVLEEEKEPLQDIFGKEPEEETCPSCVQRQEKLEEEEPLQGKFETIQRQEPEDEEKLQMKSVVQRQEISEEEEPLQGKMTGTIQRQEIPEEEPLQKKSESNTGMPDNLKAGVESLSRIDMSDVRVHYNSSKPAKVGALAYTQGTNIHVAPGQEKHLPHEAWHVVQQKQGRVQPMVQMKDGVTVNDDEGLEHEADVMGVRSVSIQPVIQLQKDVVCTAKAHAINNDVIADEKGYNDERADGKNENTIKQCSKTKGIFKNVQPLAPDHGIFHCAEPNALAKLIESCNDNDIKKIKIIKISEAKLTHDITNEKGKVTHKKNEIKPRCENCRQWIHGEKVIGLRS